MADGRRVGGYDQRPSSTTEYQRFKSEYFSGADVRIYFGDIWVDEITNLQFTLQEQVVPIYGYASYTWDKVARGNRFIQGSFNINFKESYYLHSVMQRLSSKMKTNSTTTPMFDTKQWKEGLDIEHLIAKAGKSSFDELANEFEKTMWGEAANVYLKDITRGRFMHPYFNNDEQLQEHGFNILIAYGPMNEPNGMNASSTAHSLVDVQLTGVSQIVGGDGRPVEEQYTFIARDLDGNVAKVY